jgi:hypothetical protein
VKSLIAKIKRMPTKGDLMIDFAPTIDLQELIFSNPVKKTKQKIEFFGTQVKTPATSFLMEGPPEETFFEEMMAGFIKPEFDKKIPILPAVEIELPSLKVLFEGETKSTPSSATATFTTRKFKVSSMKAKESVYVEVMGGQVTPQDQKFSLDGKDYIFKTFDANDKNEFYPAFFKILKK